MELAFTSALHPVLAAFEVWRASCVSGLLGLLSSAVEWHYP